MRDAGGSNLVGPRGVVSLVISAWIFFSGASRFWFLSCGELSGFGASEAYLGLGRGGNILVFAGLLHGLGKGSSRRGGNIFLVMSDGHSIGAVEGLSAGSTLVRIGANVGCL
jgi:hypothetical protein